jgi:hypothetical protein
MPDNTLSTLAQIRTKVRRLTRSPSTAQLTDADIDSYVNNFVLYDFPEHLRLFKLRTTFTFYTKPYVDTYATNTTTLLDPLYNFKNKYVSVHPPVYIAGYNSFYSQNREQFFGIYPIVNSVDSIGSTGDGVTTNFTGTLPNAPFLQNNVTFTSVAVANVGLINETNTAIAVKDVPSDPFDGTGTFINAISGAAVVGNINYINGLYNITFPVAPGSGQAINVETVPYQAAQPQALLYYQDTFTVRPVPDESYPINMEVYIRPTELLLVTDMPELSEWWQYIAYGASKKVFEDRMDLDSVQLIMAEFKKQELLAQRRTIVQYTNERTATIYIDQVSYGPGNGFGMGDGNY